MTHAAGIVWRALGEPLRPSITPEPAPAVCAVHRGPADITTDAAKTLGPNFADYQMLARGHTRLCVACAWCITGRPPDTVRMWTVIVRPGGGLPASSAKAPWGNERVWLGNRGDSRPIAAALASPPDGPWALAVAESAQKHTLPYTPINHGQGRWTVQMDAMRITATPDQFRHVLGHVVTLRAAGFTATQVEQLDLMARPPKAKANSPSPIVGVTADMLTTWRYHAAALADWAGSGLLHLACWLPTKETIDDYTNRYGADGPRTGRPGGDLPQRDPRLGEPVPDTHVGSGQVRAGDGDDRGLLW